MMWILHVFLFFLLYLLSELNIYKSRLLNFSNFIKSLFENSKITLLSKNMFRNHMLFIVLLLLIFCISLEFNKEYIFTISKKSKLDCFCIRNITFLLWYRFNDTLQIPVKPLLVNITNKRAHLSALRTYEIECTSSGSRPEAVITWWKGNHQVKHMARNVSITFLNLRLPCSISTMFTR